MTDDRERCRRVTGRSSAAHLRTLDVHRRGPLRQSSDAAHPLAEETYDVLCGALARWIVSGPGGSDTCCSSCLAVTCARLVGDGRRVVVRAIPVEALMPRPQGSGVDSDPRMP